MASSCRRRGHLVRSGCRGSRRPRCLSYSTEQRDAHHSESDEHDEESELQPADQEPGERGDGGHPAGKRSRPGTSRGASAPIATIASQGSAAKEQHAAGVNPDVQSLDDGTLGGWIAPARGDVAVQKRRALREPGHARQDPAGTGDDPEEVGIPDAIASAGQTTAERATAAMTSATPAVAPRQTKSHRPQKSAAISEAVGSSSVELMFMRARRRSDEEGDREAERSPSGDAQCVGHG